MREFGVIYIDYMGFLIARKNYGFWLPSVLSELGKGKGEAGALGSTFEMTYGAASLLNGVLIDVASPKHFLVGGLVLSGLCSVCIGSTTSLPVMVPRSRLARRVVLAALYMPECWCCARAVTRELVHEPMGVEGGVVRPRWSKLCFRPSSLVAPLWFARSGAERVDAWADCSSAQDVDQSHPYAV